MDDQKLFAFIACLFFLGCGITTEQISASQTDCQAGVAQVAITDGFLQILCGCQEASGTSPTPPATLTCTVPVDTTVVFQYLNTSLTHEVIPAGALTFPASPVSNPAAGLQNGFVRSHFVRFSTTGTYDFEDAYNSSLSGHIVVF